MSVLGYRPTNLSAATKAGIARAYEGHRTNEARAAAVLAEFTATGDLAVLARKVDRVCESHACTRPDEHPEHL